MANARPAGTMSINATAASMSANTDPRAAGTVPWYTCTAVTNAAANAASPTNSTKRLQNTTRARSTVAHGPVPF